MSYNSIMAITLITTVARIGVAQAAEPAVTIGISPDARVAINPVNLSDGTTISSLLSGGSLASVAPMSFYVTNFASKPIAVIVILWKATGSSGRHTTARWACDNFLSVNMAPALSPNGRLLVVGRQFMPEAKIGPISNTAAFQSGVQNDVKYILNQATIEVTVDAVIFSDGEVVGPDSAAYTKEVVDRQTAKSRILSAVDQANTAGISLPDALGGFVNARLSSTDKVGKWEKRFAESTIRYPEAFAKYLRRLPTLPTFSNTTTQEVQ